GDSDEAVKYKQAHRMKRGKYEHVERKYHGQRRKQMIAKSRSKPACLDWGLFGHLSCLGVQPCVSVGWRGEAGSIKRGIADKLGRVLFVGSVSRFALLNRFNAQP